MSVISKNNKLLTVLVYFKIEQQHQIEQLNLIKGFVEKSVKKQHGFVSANFHTSIDGTRIVNYAQWGSIKDYNAGFVSQDVVSASKGVFNYAQWKKREDVEAMLNSQEARKSMDSIHKIATPDWHLYNVPYIALP